MGQLRPGFPLFTDGDAGPRETDRVPQPTAPDGYRCQLASDLDRDGMGLELIHQERGIVAEVFHFDETGHEMFSTFGELSLDLADAQRFINRARATIRPTRESARGEDEVVF